MVKDAAIGLCKHIQYCRIYSPPISCVKMLSLCSLDARVGTVTSTRLGAGVTGLFHCFLPDCFPAAVFVASDVTLAAKAKKRTYQSLWRVVAETKEVSLDRENCEKAGAKGSNGYNH